MKHIIYRLWLALARDETFLRATQDGFALMVKALSGTPEEVQYAEQQYSECPEIVEAIERIWGKTPEQCFEAKVVSNPGLIANRLICYEIAKKFDMNVPQFEKGFLDIPKRCSFIVPKYNGNLIERLQFFRIVRDTIQELG